MNDESILIAIAGLVSTVAVSAIGFYFTYKSQRSPLRAHLYTKQVEFLVAFSVVATRIQQVAKALMNVAELTPDEIKQAQCLWDDLEGDLHEVTQKSGVVMPSDIYSSMTAYRECTQVFKESLVSETGSEEAYFALMGAAGQIFMVGRELVGADNLSVESVNLHSSNGYKKMQHVGRDSHAMVMRALWTRGGNQNS